MGGGTGAESGDAKHQWLHQRGDLKNGLGYPANFCEVREANVVSGGWVGVA